MSSWLDLMPSTERAKVRKRLRSPEAYAETRESIPSVEKISEQMDKNAQLAELSMALEMEPALKQALQEKIQEDMAQGMESMLHAPEGVPEELKDALQQGIDVSIDTNPHTNEDQIVIAPEGNVSEKIPLSTSLSDTYVAQFMGDL